jgi:hypothetical protein
MTHPLNRPHKTQGMTYHRDMFRLLLLPLLCACSEYTVSGKTETALGTAPAIEVYPTTIDFGTAELAGHHGNQVVSVSNVGDAPLEVYSARLSTPGVEFSVTVMDETTLQPAEDLELVVSFSPVDEGMPTEVLVIQSSDSEQPESLVSLQGAMIIPTDLPPEDPPEEVLGTPIIKVSPAAHSFGTIGVGDMEHTEFSVRNIGDAPLIISETMFEPSSAEMIVNLHLGANGPLPWTLGPEEAKHLSLDYAPTDDVFDFAQTIFHSNDEDQPEAVFSATGNARAFEGFSGGWYVYDDGLEHETTSSPDHPVTVHGDLDLYWYEPSGAHGLVGSVDPETDFAMMREHVLVGAGEPTPVTGPISFDSASTLATYAFATFTYVMCDFWIEADEDPGLYTVQADAVDDGIQVMVNGQIIDHMLLGATPTSWSLAEVGRPGEINTLVVILVDDSASMRYLHNLTFYRDGVMVE